MVFCGNMTNYENDCFQGELELYVSYKFGFRNLCEFDTQLSIKSYLIVDVTNQVALIAACHSETSANLYVGKLITTADYKIKFLLSLEEVFAFFPGNSWPDTWL